MPAGFRYSRRVVEQDQRLLFIVAASRRSAHLRGHVGRRSQTLGTCLATLSVDDEDAIPFSTALVLQRALLQTSAAEELWGLAWSVGVSCNRARSLWFAGLAQDDLLTWGLAPSSGRCLCLHRHTLCERCRCCSLTFIVAVVPSLFI